MFERITRKTQLKQPFMGDLTIGFVSSPPIFPQFFGGAFRKSTNVLSNQFSLNKRQNTGLILKYF
jgi:hypothetical protein